MYNLFLILFKIISYIIVVRKVYVNFEYMENYEKLCMILIVMLMTILYIVI